MVSTESLKFLKYHNFFKKALLFSIICSKFKNEDEQLFKEKESIEILKILSLIKNI